MTAQRVNFILFFVAVLAMTVVSGKRIASFAGPYRVIIRRTENVSDDFTSTGEVWMKLYTTWPKPKQLQYVTGMSYNSIPLDDELKMEVHMAKWSNNQYKSNAFDMRFHHACSDSKFTSPSFLELFFNEDGKNCPIKPGHRHIKNRTFELTFPRIPVFPYGRYLFTLILKRETTTVGLFVAEWETIPKF